MLCFSFSVLLVVAVVIVVVVVAAAGGGGAVAAGVFGFCVFVLVCDLVSVSASALALLFGFIEPGLGVLMCQESDFKRKGMRQSAFKPKGM